MPTTLLGFVLFATLLMPGVAYVTTRDRFLAVRQLSPLRETAAVVAVSLTCNWLAISAFGTLRSIRPESTPDIGLLIRDRTSYFERNYLSLTVAGALTLLLAAAIGAGAGHLMGRRLSATSTPIELVSGWTKAFGLYPETYKVVHCELADGTVVSGSLLSFTPQLEETGDRSIILTAPLTIRVEAEETARPWPNGTVVLAASQLKHVAVAYLDEDPAELAVP